MKKLDKINFTTRKYKYIEKRKAARGIALDGDNVLMVHIGRDDTYTFPGGGLELGESLEEACVREMEEEVGAQGVRIIKDFGFIDEMRDSIFKKDTAFNMISYYYLCQIDNIDGKMKLEDYEKDLGFSAIWIDIEQALVHNENIKNTENFQTKKVRYLDRAILVLKILKEGLCE